MMRYFIDERCLYYWGLWGFAMLKNETSPVQCHKRPLCLMPEKWHQQSGKNQPKMAFHFMKAGLKMNQKMNHPKTLIGVIDEQ